MEKRDLTQILKVGQIVWATQLGSVTVLTVENIENELDYPIKVMDKEENIATYTNEGLYTRGDRYPSIFLTMPTPFTFYGE